MLEIKHILKGNLSGILQQYRSLQMRYVEEMAFEKAAIIQKKIEGLKNYQSNSVVVNPKWGDLDVFATARDEKKIVVSYLLVRNGSIANSGTHAFDIRMEETEEEVLAQSILHFQKLYNSESLELILPYQLEYGFSAFRITVPKSGEKKKLLDIAMKNAGHLIEDLKKKKTSSSW